MIILHQLPYHLLTSCTISYSRPETIIYAIRADFAQRSGVTFSERCIHLPVQGDGCGRDGGARELDRSFEPALFFWGRVFQDEEGGLIAEAVEETLPLVFQVGERGAEEGGEVAAGGGYERHWGNCVRCSYEEH